MTPDQLTKQRAAAPQAEHPDPQEIIRIVNAHGGGRSTLITVLSDIQAKYRYLPQDALRIVAEQIGIPLVDVYAAATFYHSFSLKPKGKHIVLCCQGTACHVRGGARIAEELQRQLGITPGETTPDMLFSLETVNCLGACALGPVVVVDGRYFSKVTTAKVHGILRSAVAEQDEADLKHDERVFPLRACCPHCERSLMDEAHPLHGSASISLIASVNSASGWARFSGLYGIRATQMQHEVGADEVVELSCPHCRASLIDTRRCPECGTPMAHLTVAGGQLMLCSRRGCDGCLLDLGPAARRSACGFVAESTKGGAGGLGQI